MRFLPLLGVTLRFLAFSRPSTRCFRFLSILTVLRVYRCCFCKWARLSQLFVEFCVSTRNLRAQAKTSMHKACRAFPCDSLDCFPFPCVFCRFDALLDTSSRCGVSECFRLALLQLEHGCRFFTEKGSSRASGEALGAPRKGASGTWGTQGGHWAFDNRHQAREKSRAPRALGHAGGSGDAGSTWDTGGAHGHKGHKRHTGQASGTQEAKLQSQAGRPWAGAMAAKHSGDKNLLGVTVAQAHFFHHYCP